MNFKKWVKSKQTAGYNGAGHNGRPLFSFITALDYKNEVLKLDP